MARGSLIITAAAFAVGAIAATAVSLFALSSIGTGLGQTQSLGGAPLPTATASAPSQSEPASTGVPTSSSTHLVSAPTTSADSAGGLVVATCRNGGAYLLSWSPKPGFRVDQFVRGPAATALIKFEGLAGESTVIARCTNGTPVITVSGDDHGTGTHN
jgi:hypothetical protein